MLDAARAAAPHALRLPAELHGLRAAARVRLEALGGDLRELSVGADEARVLLAALDGGDAHGGGDEFARRLRGLVGEWDAQVREGAAARLEEREGDRRAGGARVVW